MFIGMNLLQDSEFIDKSKATFASTTSAQEGASYNFEGIPSYATNNTKQVIVTFPTLTIGKTYTFSYLFHRGYAVKTMKVAIGEQEETLATINSSSWQQMSITFVATEQTTQAVANIVDSSTTNWTCNWKNFKLEVGNAATEWTPHYLEGGVNYLVKHIDGNGLSHLMTKLKTKYGEPEAPYTEVEWVESNGKQFVYLDWKPKIATWGFEADFIIRNAFNSAQAAWNASTNVSNAGAVFGVRNASGVNNVEFSSYGTNGLLRLGGSSSKATSATFKKDKTRQTVKLIGTTLTNADGTTTTVTRDSEAANKPYCNMTVFAFHEGLRKAGYGSVLYPGTVRIYSLKFYDSSTLECDLVGAIRKSDGVTGLYDKVAGKFYPAPGCTYGNAVGDLGDPLDVSSSIAGTIPYLVAYNDTNTRMLRVNAPTLDKLEDGQAIRLTYLYAIGNSYQTTELAGWDDTSNNSNVYIKLTLSDDSETEWIPCYYNAYTHLTTHYYAGSPLLLTYRENVFIGATATSSGTAVMRGFWVDQDYNTNTTANNYSDTVIAGLNGVGRYTLCMRDANDNWTKIINENNKAGVSDKTAYAGGLRLGKIIYHNSGSDISAGSNTGSMLGSAIAVDLRYSLNGIANAASTTLQFRKPVYLVGTVNASDGLFYLDQTKWWSQELPITEDGKVYILFGWAYSSYYAAYLSEYNPAYVYKNGHIQELTNGHVVQKDVPADAVFTDTTALGSMTGTLGVAHGGTGQTSGVNAANYFLNELSTGSSDPVDNDYYISQYVNGGTTTTTYHRRPVSKLWNYIKGKISSVLGLSESGYTGNAATATTAGNVTGTIAIANGGTGATSAANARTNLGVPPTSHAASATTYGAGTGSNYGHVKLSDATDGTAAAASGGTAATPKAVSDALTAAKTYADGKNNQNAFSNVKVGSTTVAADTTTDTVELAGSNVTLTPDATNDKVTIGITASNVTTALGNTAVARATADASGNNIASTYTNLTEFNAARTWYATCDTAAGTAAKVATITPATTEFTLEVGRTVYVKFANTNSAAVADISLSVNGTTAKHITYMYNSTRSNIPAVGYIVADFIYQFVYDGTYWCIQNMHYNTNSTYNLGNNQIYNSFKVKGAIAAESIAVGDASGYIQASANVTFDLSYRIVWVTKALTTSSTGGDLYSYEYSSIYDRNLATRHGFSGGTAGSTVYLYGTVSGATMTLGSTYLTTTQPVTEDGKCYIPIGKLGIQSTGANYFYFNSGVANTVYMYVEGAFRQIDPYISSGLVTGTLPISRGGTGATTAAAAWTALGGGAIGKKASLAASDIPNLSTDKLTSGTLGVARGGTGKATHTSNAVLTGNGTSAVNNVATASGALYATAANGAPSFGTLPIAQGGTGKTTAADAWTALGGGAIGKKASLAASDIPAHASTATTYGAASTSNYGHAKLSSATNSSSEALAATPKAVKAAYDKASDALAGVATLTSTVTSDYYFKVTYSISNGTTTCAAHVYSAGAEVTSTYADSCFQWYYDIGSGWVSQGTGKTKTVTTLSDFGGNVKCDFTPPES